MLKKVFFSSFMLNENIYSNQIDLTISPVHRNQENNWTIGSFLVANPNDD